MMETSDKVARYGALSPSEAGALDEAAGAAGVTVASLMAIAGWQVARCVHHVAGADRPGRAAVVAGSGNNGGDAVVAARALRCWGWDVDLHVVADRDGWRLAHLIDGFAALGISVSNDAGGNTAVAALEKSNADVVVDGLLGTGVVAPPRRAHAAVINAMAGHRVVSVDVPSGFDATEGAPLSPTVCAAATCTLGAVKRGLWSTAARPYVGELWVADIGIPVAAWAAVGLRPPLDITGGELVPVSTDT